MFRATPDRAWSRRGHRVVYCDPWKGSFPKSTWSADGLDDRIDSLVEAREQATDPDLGIRDADGQSDPTRRDDVRMTEGVPADRADRMSSLHAALANSARSRTATSSASGNRTTICRSRGTAPRIRRGARAPLAPASSMVDTASSARCGCVVAHVGPAHARTTRLEPGAQERPRSASTTHRPRAKASLSLYLAARSPVGSA